MLRAGKGGFWSRCREIRLRRDIGREGASLNVCVNKVVSDAGCRPTRGVAARSAGCARTAMTLTGGKIAVAVFSGSSQASIRVRAIGMEQRLTNI